MTITNANFDEERILKQIRKALELRNDLRKKIQLQGKVHDCVNWMADSYDEFQEKAKTVGVLSNSNEDVRSLRELLIYGCKGISAYYDHAAMLGFSEEEILNFLDGSFGFYNRRSEFG